MIVIEGPDGAGKTTLCEWIYQQFGEFKVQMGERGTKNRDDIYKTTRQDTWNAMYHELQCVEPPFVWDRLGPYSDPIYAPLGMPESREVAFTPREIRMFDWFANNMGVVILCLPDYNTVVKNVLNSRQMKGVTPNIQAVYQGYRRTMPHVFRYDYERGGLESIAIIISRHLQKRKERECLSSSTPATSASDQPPREDSPSKSTA